MVERVLVVSGDVLPLPGYPTSGAGLRAWGLGQGLRVHGFEVTFAMPAAAWRPEVPLPVEQKPLLWDYSDLETTVHAAQPEAVIFCHWPTVQIRDRLDVLTVIDFHGPHILERVFQEFGDPASNTLFKIEALRKADYFICAGEKQKSYFLAWLLISGIDLTETRIDVVPVCLPPDLPLPSQGEIVFVYGGVYLPWQDPTLVLTAVADILAKRDVGVLRLFGGRHPVFPTEVLQVPLVFRELEKRLSGHPRVHFEGIRPRDELLEIYQRATVAVDLMTHNYERELAFTTRTVEYMWCGLPVIYNNYAELSPLIHQYEAGWVLDPTDGASIERVIHDILDYPELAHERGSNAQRLVREHLTWDKAIKPLATLLQKHQGPASHDVVVYPPLVFVRPHRFPEERGMVGNILYLLNEAWFHYRRGGLRTLWKESFAFLKRQIARK